MIGRYRLLRLTMSVCLVAGCSDSVPDGAVGPALVGGPASGQVPLDLSLDRRRCEDDETMTDAPKAETPVTPLKGRALALLVACGLLIAMQAGEARAQAAGAPPACDDVAGFHRLDFWLGEWDVQVEGRTVGHNRIEKILDGCAVMEHWRDAGGAEGKSLFYYVPETDTWKQVWITARATRPGGVKEKVLVETLEDGSLRFQGEIPIGDGGAYLDRTTLTPLSRGRVRQVIETSRDGGRTWRAGFDAIYVPAGA